MREFRGHFSYPTRSAALGPRVRRNRTLAVLLSIGGTASLRWPARMRFNERSRPHARAARGKPSADWSAPPLGEASKHREHVSHVSASACPPKLQRRRATAASK